MKNFLCASIVVFGMATNVVSEAAPAMSREEFQKQVFRGLPEEKLLEVLGEPQAKEAGQRPGIEEWVYRSQILGKKAVEQVTVLILLDYKSVESIRWADGTTSEE